MDRCIPARGAGYQHIYGALFIRDVTAFILQYSGIPEGIAACAKEKGITFSTPTEIVTKLKSVSQLDVPYPMSWVDEERDTSCWLGNVMQREAFNKLYSVAERVHICDDRRIKQDWIICRRSNNFRFMTTRTVE